MAETFYTPEFYDEMADTVDPTDIASVMDEFDQKMDTDPVGNSRLIRTTDDGEDRITNVCEVRYLIMFLLKNQEASAYKIQRCPPRLRDLILTYQHLD